MENNREVTSDNWKGIDYKRYSDRDRINQQVTSIDSMLNRCRVTTPFDFTISKTESAKQAFNSVLKSAGASYKRDAIDTRIINETRTGTATYGSSGMVDSQNDVGGWVELKSLPAPIDSDNDGIPDAWELKNKLNPNDASDGSKFSLSKEYTNLELYLNQIVKTIIH